MYRSRLHVLAVAMLGGMAATGCSDQPPAPCDHPPRVRAVVDPPLRVQRVVIAGSGRSVLRRQP